jgi:hypothetical protein
MMSAANPEGALSLTPGCTCIIDRRLRALGEEARRRFGVGGSDISADARK